MNLPEITRDGEMIVIDFKDLWESVGYPQGIPVRVRYTKVESIVPRLGRNYIEVTLDIPSRSKRHYIQYPGAPSEPGAFPVGKIGTQAPTSLTEVAQLLNDLVK